MGVTGDPDADRETTVSTRAPRAAHRHPGLLALIFLGGTVGTAVRSTLEDAFPADPTGIPWVTLAINGSGSLLLGLLLEALTRTGPDAGWRRRARLTVGTGVLGGFTTYSTFAVETVQRLSSGSLAVGLVYAVGSIVVGAAAAAAGYATARRISHRPGPERGR